MNLAAVPLPVLVSGMPTAVMIISHHSERQNEDGH